MSGRDVYCDMFDMDPLRKLARNSSGTPVDPRRDMRRDRVSSSAASSSAVKSLGSMTARSMATGRPRCRPRSITAMRTSLDSLRNPPDSLIVSSLRRHAARAYE